METFKSLFEEILEKNPKIIKKSKNSDLLDEKNIITNAKEFSEKVGISETSLSRLKNEKIPLTDHVIKKIYEYFVKFDQDYANELKVRLEKIKIEISPETEKNIEPASTKYLAVQELTKLFQQMSQEGSLMIGEYRDFPVSLGSFPELVESTITAIKNGLNFAIFQPFGNRKSLIKKKNLISEKIIDIDIALITHADEIINAYDYLVRLASKVSQLYFEIEESLTSEEKNRVVLYEAEYKQADKELKAISSLTACGISSRLFYAEYADFGNRSQTKIYEWVSAQNNNYYFHERTNATLNFNAVKMQYNPIPAYWATYEKLPKTDEELKKAYNEFGFKKLFDEEEMVRWNIWKPDDV